MGGGGDGGFGGRSISQFGYDRDMVHCLVSRSTCRVKMGDPKGGLQDAEQAVKESLGSTTQQQQQQQSPSKGQQNPDARALLAKAEALYALGEFELALVDFHRGGRQRPEIVEFRNGVQKATEAIQSAIGKVDVATLREQRAKALDRERRNKSGGATPSVADNSEAGERRGSGGGTVNKSVLTKQQSQQHQQLNHRDRRHSKPSQAPASRGLGRPVTNASYHHLAGAPPHTAATTTSAAPASGIYSAPMDPDKFFLEELYEEKIYLSELMRDRVLMESCEGETAELVKRALQYLETRAAFWRQRNPTLASADRSSSGDGPSGSKLLQIQRRHPSTLALRRKQRREELVLRQHVAEVERERQQVSATGANGEARKKYLKQRPPGAPRGRTVWSQNQTQQSDGGASEDPSVAAAVEGGADAETNASPATYKPNPPPGLPHNRASKHGAEQQQRASSPPLYKQPGNAMAYLEKSPYAAAMSGGQVRGTYPGGRKAVRVVK